MRSAAAAAHAQAESLDAGDEHRDELRLWLQLLTCSNLVEAKIRHELRERLGTTLPRFDLLAQLARFPDGVMPSELARLMICHVNIGLMLGRLHEQGLVAREPWAGDRRVPLVRLTAAGEVEFARMAAEHRAWIRRLFGDFSPDEITMLLKLLTRLKGSVQKSLYKDAR
jgi:DNA-binding MarR family transcriptional regulator